MTQSRFLIVILLVVLGIVGFLFYRIKSLEKKLPSPSNITSEKSIDPLYQKFQILSTQGNSSCSGDYKNFISQMPDSQRLQGSCCSPMSWHRYQEQIDGLKEYQNIAEIPPDPYDIEAKLAKQLLAYYDEVLTPEEQKAYDYAMQTSDEKGPCCCKCWRWYVYGGLGKYLIKEKGFTGEQVTEVWNLSDGCGGEGDHVTHTS